MSRAVPLAGFLLLGLFCASAANSTVREPAVAGTFYPADSAALAAMVGDHLSAVGDSASIDGELIALIVPHAGLIYSGPIAAYSYKLLEDSGVENVILCGPSHRLRFEGVSVYGPGVAWKTPLGTVPCDDRLCKELIDFDPLIAESPQAHEAEHCLEVQLPYLQTVLKEFEIVPAIMGRPDPPTARLLAAAMVKLSPGGRTVMIASTDWQHYRAADEGWKMDSLGIDCLMRLDARGLENHLKSGRVEMCGGGPTVAVIKAAVARGANSVKILRYGDSGDVSGDKGSVVGYVAAAIYKARVGQGSEATLPDSPDAERGQIPTAMLSDSDKTTLLRIARQSIESYLQDGNLPTFEVSGILAQPGAAFVTLEKQGQLRGCIGYTVASTPLYRTVSECAVKAAVADPRFPLVQASELADLHLEISVLTPLQRVESLEEIQVGRDGLMISMGGNRGLLLPQVATDYGWDRTEFLRQTCRKAGLPAEAYQSPGAVIEKFQAVIFEE
ncbi:MAG TPA: AmmeMemoRadiSam system protein B [Acidobacteriota bacterium]|nr:AmmeMemoRadiSam system protein B [Acidobacteriota bacterium]